MCNTLNIGVEAYKPLHVFLTIVLGPGQILCGSFGYLYAEQGHTLLIATKVLDVLYKNNF